MGLTIDDSKEPLWLDSGGWKHELKYAPGTNVIEARSEHHRAKVEVAGHVFALSAQDQIVLAYKVTNRANRPRNLRLSVYAAFRINESPYDTTTLVDEPAGAMVFYLRDVAIAISCRQNIIGYQCGVQGESSSALHAVECGVFNGSRIQHKAPDAAMTWDFGEVECGHERRFELFISVSNSLESVLASSAQIRAQDTDRVLEETEGFWRDWIVTDHLASEMIGPPDERKAGGSKPPSDFPPDQTSCAATATASPQTSRPVHSHADFIEALADKCGRNTAELYDRSLLALKLLSDKHTGAIIAAPEFDRPRQYCGGYGYVWPRDGAFIGYSLDVAGKREEAEAYLDYARRVQQPNGVWLHRYFATGQLASSWGLIQIDETGAMIWGMAQHYQITGSKEFLTRSWDSIDRAATHLASALDPETGLPLPSMDLWEEEFSESVYAAAATAGGFAAASECALTLGKQAEAREWARLADQIRSAVRDQLWDSHAKLVLRSINKRISEEAYKKGRRRDRRNYDKFHVNGELYPTFIQRTDRRAESSALGLVFPFAVFEPSDPMIRQTVSTLAKRLWVKKTGGIMRYEDDRYVGGNPWILTTLWLAIYYLEAGDRKRALSLIRWAVDHETSLGLLTEQVDKKSGEPVWAVPLGWSHAMLVIAARKAVQT